MDYLFKVFYKFKNKYEKTYQDRYHFSTTLKTSFNISPYKSEEDFPLFYVYNQYSNTLIDKIRKNDNELRQLEMALPGIAKESLLIDIIGSELESSNNLEGINTKKDDIIESTRTILNNKKTSKLRMSSMIKSYLLLVNESDSLKLPIDCKDIRKVYDEITKDEIEAEDLPDGRFFRKGNAFVQKNNSVSGEIIHQGIIGEEKIELAISDMLEFLHDDRISSIIQVAISHYYFAYIHPFYDGNGRVGRFISSMFINSSYHYLTSMSLSRGAYIYKTNYYKAFSNTNSAINRGELNYFVDEFLMILIAGQEDILDSLRDKMDRLKNALESIEDLSIVNTDLKKNLLFMLYQSYYFANNSGIERDLLIKYASENYPVLKIKRELSELENDKIIVKVKSRPIIYAVNKEY